MWLDTVTVSLLRLVLCCVLELCSGLRMQQRTLQLMICRLSLVACVRLRLSNSYLSYPTNAEGYFDERTGKRMTKPPAMSSAAADGYDIIEEEVWKWECSVTSYTMGEQFTQYTINCRAFNTEWRANTRYSEMVR
jgi:hypothetical protein